MPQTYLNKELYDEIIRNGHDVNIFLHQAVRELLNKETVKVNKEEGTTVTSRKR